MNVYEAIRVLLAVSGIDGAYTFHPAERRITIISAQLVAAEIIAKYDALAPDWSRAPGWAQWYVIDADGEAILYAREPAYDSDGWHVIGVTNVSYCESVNLPLGIDWRLCKWSRPEVTK